MPKHILVVSQYFHPESFRINDMCLEWVKRGYKVTVLTGIPNYPEGKFYKGYGWFRKRKETWNGVDIIRIPLIARGKTSVGLAFNYLSFVISGIFWKIFTGIKADLVFTFEVSPMTQALVGVWYSKKRKIPHYLYVQDLWPENVEIVTGIHSKIIISPISRMVNYIYKNCDKIFATSPCFVKEIQKRTPGEENKVMYWPQYAEDYYRPVQEKSKLIPQDGIFNITFTGNIGVAQGLEILPKTAKLLKAQGIKVRFNIVGDGRQKDELTHCIFEHDVEEYFNMVGWQPAKDIPMILAASDVAFLSFANNELFAMTIPAKLQSYMACGIPILASAIGESERIINEAQCGICCEIGSFDELAKTIKRMSAMDLQCMRENARVYCKDNFDKTMLMECMDGYLK